MPAGMLEMLQKECKENVERKFQLLACKIEFSKTIGLKTWHFRGIKDLLNESRFYLANPGLSLQDSYHRGFLLSREGTLIQERI